MAMVKRTSWLTLSDVELNVLYSVLNRVDISDVVLQNVLDGIKFELDETAEDLDIEIEINEWGTPQDEAEDEEKEGGE